MSTDNSSPSTIRRRPRTEGDDYYLAPPEEVRRAFGRRLRELRLQKGWSAAELARRAEKAGNTSVGRYSVSRYESGDAFPEPVRLLALAAGLGVDASELRPGLPVDNGGGDMSIAINHGTGRARLRMEASLPIDMALQIMTMVRAFVAPKRA